MVAADVYGGEAYAGRGGWTWYTGSAGWLYRFAVEGLLGISRKGDLLRVQPVLPPEWNGFEADLTIDGRRYAIAVERLAGSGGYAVTVNGEAIADPGVGHPLAAAP